MEPQQMSTLSTFTFSVKFSVYPVLGNQRCINTKKVKRSPAALLQSTPTRRLE